MIQRTAAKPHLVDEMLHFFTAQKMQDIYDAAAGDWRKVPTYRELSTLMKGRAAKAMLDAHHTATKAWSKELLKSLPQYANYNDAQWTELLDSMPAILINQLEHRDLGKGIGGFHSFLNRRLIPNRSYQSEEILSELQGAYTDWDAVQGPKIWSVVREWLREKGVQ